MTIIGVIEMMEQDFAGADINALEDELASSIDIEEVESAYAAIVTCDKGICPF